ncbi:MAG: hypothetical protein IT184_11795 [Acidobacteria bacterium]|nr:hypothetical protein [Acidobacteriota bacterium]
MIRGPRAQPHVLLTSLVVAAAGVCLVYAPPSGGFHYDDYHFVRPPIGTELHRIWFGSWDVTGAEREFFRPLTALLFLSRFWLFGVNATLMHGVSLAGHVLCAVLVACLVHRAGASRRAVVIAALLYSIYPALPISQTSWLTNQMHLAESLLVLGGLILWQGVGGRRPWPLVPIAVLACAAFLVKEDGLMLLAVIAVLAAAGIGASDPLPRAVRRSVPAIAAALAVALVWLRQDRLQALGGYGVPDLAQAIANFQRGIESAVLLWPTRRPWQAVAACGAIVAVTTIGIDAWRARRQTTGALAIGIAAAFVPALAWLFQGRPGSYPLFSAQALSGALWLATLLVGGWAARRLRDRTLTSLFVLGLTVILCFNLPFVLVTKREQLHLISIGAVLWGAAALDATLRRLDARWVTVAGLIVLLATPLTLLARSQTKTFAPCSESVRLGDEAALGSWVVPAEIKQYLRDKTEQCASGAAIRSLTDLDQIWWGTFDATVPAGEDAYRWTEDRATALFRREARRVTLELRAVRAVSVTAVVDGAETVLPLQIDAWTSFTFDLTARGPLTWLRAAHRLDLFIDGWVVPADDDPASTDLRRHGVQLGSVRVE